MTGEFSGGQIAGAILALAFVVRVIVWGYRRITRPGPPSPGPAPSRATDPREVYIDPRLRK